MYHRTKMKFSVKKFFRKCEQNRSFMVIYSYLLKKSFLEYFIFCLITPEVVIHRCSGKYMLEKYRKISQENISGSAVYIETNVFNEFQNFFGRTVVYRFFCHLSINELKYCCDLHVQKIEVFR